MHKNATTRFEVRIERWSTSVTKQESARWRKERGEEKKEEETQDGESKKEGALDLSLMEAARKE